MEFVAAKCPSCGGELQVPQGPPTVVCMYCGGTIVVKQAIAEAASGNVDNWLRLAKAAEDGNNSEEAYGYYTKVLEVNSSNVGAWFGRGRTAGWASTLKNLRLPEMVASFLKGIEFSSNGEREQLKMEAGATINAVTIAYYKMARTSLQKYASLPDTWGEYLEQCSSMISGLEAAHNLDPTNKTVLENIVHICTENVQGFSYADKYDTVKGIPLPKVKRISPVYESKLRSMISAYVPKLQALDPGYKAPIVKKAVGLPCFVATATMGDANHPDVVLLRRFRDQVLAQGASGRAFIRLYWTVGPYVARLIEPSPILRAVVQVTIVKPAVRVSRWALQSALEEADPRH